MSQEELQGYKVTELQSYQFQVQNGARSFRLASPIVVQGGLRELPMSVTAHQRWNGNILEGHEGLWFHWDSMEKPLVVFVSFVDGVFTAGAERRCRRWETD